MVKFQNIRSKASKATEKKKYIICKGIISRLTTGFWSAIIRETCNEIMS